LEDAMGCMSLRLVYLLNYPVEQGPSFEGSEEIPFMGDIIPLCISQYGANYLTKHNI
jgi:hypothetical protein